MTFIKLNLTETQVQELVDQIITPEYADTESRALIQILAAATDGETSDDSYRIMMQASHHAYRKTNHYEQSFKDFASGGKIEQGEEKERSADCQLIG